MVGSGPAWLSAPGARKDALHDLYLGSCRAGYVTARPRPPLRPNHPAGEVDASPGRALGLSVATGFVGVLLIGGGATLAGTPFDVHSPGAWVFGMGHIGMFRRVVGLIGVFVGIAMLLLAWYRVIIHLRQRPEFPVRTVVLIFGLWVAPLLIAPPLFSQDVYSYVAQGTMLSQGVNPYEHGPAAVAATDPGVVHLVDPLWLRTPVPYGPLFVGLEATAVISSHHHEVTAVEELRVLALVGVLLAAAALVPLGRRAGTPPGLVVALVLLNPLTLLGLVSPGHNDALLAGLILCAVAVLARGRPALAVVICALAAAVKSPALVATAFVTWQWAYREDSWRRRLGAVAASFAITFLILDVLGRVTGVGSGWIRTAGTPGLVRSVLTPTTDMAVLAGHVARVFHLTPTSTALLSTFRTLGYLAAAGLICWFLWRSRDREVLLPLGLSLLVLVALGPVFQPWYLAWGVFCLAPVAAGRWRLLLIAASTFGTVALLPRFEPLVGSTGLLGDVSGIAAALALAALAVPSVAERAAVRLNRMIPTLSQSRWMPPPDEPLAVTPFETSSSGPVGQPPPAYARRRSGRFSSASAEVPPRRTGWESPGRRPTGAIRCHPASTPAAVPSRLASVLRGPGCRRRVPAPGRSAAPYAPRCRRLVGMTH